MKITDEGRQYITTKEFAWRLQAVMEGKDGPKDGHLFAAYCLAGLGDPTKFGSVVTGRTEEMEKFINENWIEINAAVFYTLAGQFDWPLPEVN